MLNKFFITLISSKMNEAKTHLHPLKPLLTSSIYCANQFFAPKSVDPSTIPDATTHSNTFHFLIILMNT